jgi:uncharacterized membrane protein
VETGFDLLLISAVLFVVSHLGLASPLLRPWLMRRLGERVYSGLYSLLALGLVVWLAVAYGHAPQEPIWAGEAMRWLPLVAMPFALILLVTGVSGPNPSAKGQEGLLRAAPDGRGILRVTRHPVLLATGLWALAHLLAKGDAASLVFFGAFVVVVALGIPAQERRKRAALGTEWTKFAEATSVVPFAAILAGRNRFQPGEIGWGRLAVALALYAALLAVHPWVFGARPY